MASVWPIVAITVVASIMIPALLLWLCARLFKAPHATFRRALVATVFLFTIGIVAAFAHTLLASAVTIGPHVDPSLLIAEAAILIVQVVVAWFVVARAFGTSLGRGILIWLANLVPLVAFSVGLVFVLKTFVMTAYTVPTNSMAPTIIGWHRTGQCPLCTGELIIPGPDPTDLFPRDGEIRDELCVCASCAKSTKLKPKENQVRPMPGDRLIVNLMLKPQRWDIIVFRFPREPARKYLFRLVGMPGETVYIKDGCVWINDVKQRTPDELKGLQYTPFIGEIPEHGEGMTNLGTPENPLRLGPNDCCVLGDFPERASDSRDWGPVPMENVEGVVCATYWPVTRWKILR